MAWHFDSCGKLSILALPLNCWAQLKFPALGLTYEFLIKKKFYVQIEFSLTNFVFGLCRYFALDTSENISCPKHKQSSEIHAKILAAKQKENFSTKATTSCSLIKFLPKTFANEPQYE